jgi:hypothetical protein
MNLTATDFAAWIGAVAGVSAVVWDVYKWTTAGPRLRISMMPKMKMIGGPPRRSHMTEEQLFVVLTVSNFGSQRTTITKLIRVQYDSTWARYARRKRVLLNRGRQARSRPRCRYLTLSAHKPQAKSSVGATILIGNLPHVITVDVVLLEHMAIIVTAVRLPPG